MRNMTESTRKPFDMTGITVRPIRTESDYRMALAEVERLMDAEAGTPEGDRLDVLVTLVSAYEARHHPVPPPDPIEAILHTMERRGLTRRDIERYVGPRSRVSEILARKRPLTLSMVRKLSNGLGIPADVLIQPYAIDRRDSARRLSRSSSNVAGR